MCAESSTYIRLRGSVVWSVGLEREREEEGEGGGGGWDGEWLVDWCCRSVWGLVVRQE